MQYYDVLCKVADLEVQLVAFPSLYFGAATGCAISHETFKNNLPKLYFLQHVITNLVFLKAFSNVVKLSLELSIGLVRRQMASWGPS